METLNNKCSCKNCERNNSKSNNLWSLFIGGLNNLGGITQFAEMLSNNNKLYYACPICNCKRLEKGMLHCINCGIKLSWEKVND